VPSNEALKLTRKQFNDLAAPRHRRSFEYKAPAWARSLAIALDGHTIMSDSSGSIDIRTDTATARVLRDVLYALGEHQAAGAPMPTLDADESTRLGALLRDLDVQLGGAGRMT
jgi:hypothetical protein